MKIFYSWQSDTPKKTGHFLIRNALQDAINDMEIDEADRPELDHDTKGVMGAPPIFETILDKIDGCDIFVADLTIVGNTRAGKPLINPNVAIELGYALKSRGDKALLLIMNESYGGTEGLPFDLQHRRWPTTFTLNAEANNPACKTAREKLVIKLGPILEEYKNVHRSETQETFLEAKSTVSPAHYFETNEHIAEFRSKKLSCSAKTMLYLRIFPKYKASTLNSLNEYEISDFLEDTELGPLNIKGEILASNRNQYGGITYSKDPEKDEIISATQLFKTREIWGIDSSMAFCKEKGKLIIQSHAYEDVLKKALSRYLKFARKNLEYKLPVIVKAGMSNAKDRYMLMGNEYFDPWGPVTQNHIQKRCELSSWDETEVNAVLLDIFDEFFDACGKRRPKNFNGFPTKGED